MHYPDKMAFKYTIDCGNCQYQQDENNYVEVFNTFSGKIVKSIDFYSYPIKLYELGENLKIKKYVKNDDGIVIKWKNIKIKINYNDDEGIIYELFKNGKYDGFMNYIENDGEIWEGRYTLNVYQCKNKLIIHNSEGVSSVIVFNL